MSPKYQMLAVLSGALSILSFSILVFRVHATRETSQLTYYWLSINLLAQILLCGYGIINNSYGIYGPTAILIAGLLYILYIKIMYSVEEEYKKENK